ncbi:MAG: proprotein convertase P-domain-containing protein [Pseudomonadota bacterium]
MYFSDPLFQFQSYLSGLAAVGSQPLDASSPVLRIAPVWDDYRGKGVTISIPGAIDRLHPDIAPNYDTASLATFDPLPLIPNNPGAASLSTFWAGLAAADDNGVGLVGVAPDATLTNADGTFPVQADVVLAVSTSDRSLPYDTLYDQALQARGGLGSILITNTPFGDTFYGILGAANASGDLNTDFALNNVRHIVTVSGLSAYGLAVTGRVAGDMMLVGAPIFTDTSSTNFFSDLSPTIGPDPRGALGDNGLGTVLGFWQLLAEAQTGVAINGADYRLDISGIGASAVASGAAALILEANPTLGWRDVQEILAYSARLTDLREGPASATGFPWDINAAKTWNNGGLHYNAKHGFGALDIFGAVRLAETWHKQSTTANEATVEAERTQALPNGPFALDGTYSFSFTAPSDLKIEHVALTVDYAAERGLLEFEADMFVIRIISPEGTVSDVAAPATVFDSIDLTRVDQTYTSRKFWGETAQQGDGVWTVQLINDSGVQGEIFDLSLAFFGDANVADDTYIYTDEFNALDAFAYGTLIDDGEGLNRINAAAVTADLWLTAVPGGRAKAGGETLYTLSTVSRMAQLIGGDGNDTLIGSGADDSLSGMRGNDRLLGQAGDDLLEGGQGDDTLLGGVQGDTLKGGPGADLLRGGPQADTLNGGAGDDTVFGDAGADTIILGAGHDRFIDDAQSGANGRDSVSGGQGEDTLLGGGGNDSLLGGPDSDSISGGAGNDVLRGGPQSDTLLGGAGDDTVFGDAGADTIILGAGHDRFIDDAQNDLNGRDSVVGGAGNDTLLANGGNDTVRGGDGLDVIKGGLADDLLDGGAQADALGGGTGSDTLLGGAGNDRLDGGPQPDTLDAGAGDDTVLGGPGADVIILGAGHDRFEDDLQSGPNGADTVFGGIGNDTLVGGGGNDRLSGGALNDTLVGGDGADTFVFENPVAGGVDRLVDFVPGVDTIALNDMSFDALPDTIAPANLRVGAIAQDADDFLLYGAGQLFYDADANGPGAAVRIAILDDAPVLSADDFGVV